MRIYNRIDFLKLPAGTIYSMGKEWYFDSFCVKDESWDNDWVYLDPCWSNGKDSGECFDILADSLATGSSFEMASSYGRDGGFDPEEIFLVFEKDDLIILKDYLEKAIANSN